MNLYNKVLFLALTQLLAIFFFGIYQIESLHKIQKNSFEERLRAQTEIAKKRFDTVLDTQKKSADILSGSTDVTKGIALGDTSMLYHWSKLFLSDTIDKILFIGMEGKVLSRGASEYIVGDLVKNAHYFNEALRKGYFWGVDRVDGDITLLYSKIVNNEKSHPVGVVCVGTKVDRDFLSYLVSGSDLDIVFHVKGSEAISGSGIQILKDGERIGVNLERGAIEEYNFTLGQKSDEEIAALEKTRRNLLIGFVFIYLVLFVVLHIIFLRHVGTYENLVRKLLDYYNEKISITEFIHITKEIASRNRHDIGKIAEALSRIGQRIVDSTNRLEELSVTDQLTQIYNRRKLDEIFNDKLNERERGKVFSIILLDVDKFKKINDNHGHIVGDKILQEVALVLSSSIRKSDAIGRWGGEEFMIILPGTDNKGAMVMAEHLRGKIERYNFANSLRVTASFGVATCSFEDTESSLTKRCDDALYDAKRLGRNRVENGF